LYRYIKVPTGVPYIWHLELHNPHDAPLKVIEAVSSDRFMTLKPPKVDLVADEQRGGGKTKKPKSGAPNATKDEEDGVAFQTVDAAERVLNAMAAWDKETEEERQARMAAAAAKAGLYKL
jgi:hypothetical protein